MMSLRFILGRPGTGKTGFCLDEIAERLQGDIPLYYLVPEQFSLQSEKLLVRRAASFTRAQVLSFNRLAYQLFARMGAPPGKLVDELGRNMLLRKILYDCGGQLVYYARSADKQGFVDNLARTVTELNHYNVTAEHLLTRAQAAPPGLAAKLKDLALILQTYRETVTGRFLPADDTLTLLAQKLETATPLSAPLAAPFSTLLAAPLETPLSAPLETLSAPLSAPLATPLSTPLASPLAGSLFWVDGFTGFTPQERKVLAHILQAARRVTVVLTRRPAYDKNDPLFALTRDTQRILTDLAHSLGVTVEKPVCLETDYRHTHTPELSFFAAHFDLTGPVAVSTAARAVPTDSTADSTAAQAVPTDSTADSTAARAVPTHVTPTQVIPTHVTPTQVTPTGITLISAPDRYAEAYETARRIQQLTADEGYRFRDIAVLCGDRAAYEKILHNAFDRLGIPLFVDSKTDILPHPLTELIRAAVDVAAHNWPYESVFRFLKTRLTDLSIDDIDRLENYVLAHGIKHYRWRYPFINAADVGANIDADADVNTDTESDTNAEVVTDTAADADTQAPPTPVETPPSPEVLRQRVMAILTPFTEGLYPDKKETVRAFTRRVYDLLTMLKVTDKLTEWYEERTAAGDHETARTHRQIWPKLCEIFDKLAEILGDDVVTLREYAKILDAGLTQADLGLIPPAVDQVLLGDIGRSRFPELRALFVLGGNEGKLPPPVEVIGLFTDEERGALRDNTLELAPDRAPRVNESWFSLYCALCQPRDRLIISYASGETNGKALRPAKLLVRLKEMFPGLTEESAPAFLEYPLPSHPAPPTAVRLSPETTRRLYGSEIITGVSRIEKFAECPFSYFVTYNLKARERKIYTVQPADLGVVFHEVLAMFSRRMAEEKRSWDTLDLPEISRRVRTCVEELVSEGNTDTAAETAADTEAAPSDTHVLKSTARNRYVLEKVKRICTTSVWALAEHIRRGTFVPAGFELDFRPETPVTTLEIRLNKERRLILTGRIDRVDILQGDGALRYVKIIDYKSGQKRFSLEEALLGTQLQLLLYMNALLKNGKALFGDENVSWEARPGGVFYFHIDDPVLALDDETTPEKREALLLRCFRMSGLALEDTEAVVGMDTALAEKGGESLIIPVSINKNGLFGKRSSIASLEAFEQLGRDVENKIKEIGLAMTEGVIAPNPYKPRVCEYCRYGAICRYQPD